MAQSRGHVEVVEESVHPLAPSSPRTVEQLRAAREWEYGKWECTAPVDEPVTGARIFNPGDRVPRSHVDRFPDLFANNVRDLEAGTSATKKEG